MTDSKTLGSTVTAQAQGQTQAEQFNHLLSRSQLTPRPFRSSTPLIGPVIAWFRTAWNSVSTRWYLEPLLQQQSEHNYFVVRELQILSQNVQALQMQIHQIHQVNDAQQQAVRGLITELQALRTPIADLQALTHHLTIRTQQLEAEQQNLMQLSDEVSERLTATDQDLVSVLHDLSKVSYTLIRADEHASSSNTSSN
ncbi:hypothetical protein GC175_17830 [bacterium]|nr:hypothetical protein [bacterium]